MEAVITAVDVSSAAKIPHTYREEKREAFRQDALNTWEAYRMSGLHVSAEEADALLIVLEQGNDIEPPECHV